MANVLMAWELGGGLGHVMSLRPVGEELVRRGHRVVAAVRDLSWVAAAFAGSGVAIMPAPIMPRRGPAPFEPTHGYAQILGNVGYANDVVLGTLLDAWSTILDVVRPDLVVADHSPTALLALRGRSIKRVSMGLGFCCPPDVYPLPIWVRRENAPVIRAKAEQDEQEITARVNRLLESRRRPRLQRLGQLFGEIDDLILATYRELDQLGPRPSARYWGHWPFGMPAARPVWPEGEGPKVYAYLKAFPGVEALLTALRDRAAPTIVLGDGIDRNLRARFGCATLRIEERPLDMRQVADECGLAVLHAGHGTTATMLLAGKPCLLAPMFLEQLILARKVEQMGAARMVTREAGAMAAGLLNEMLDDPVYRDRAQAFASRYAGWTPGQQVPEVVDRLERLLVRPAIRIVKMP